MRSVYESSYTSNQREIEIPEQGGIRVLRNEDSPPCALPFTMMHVYTEPSASDATRLDREIGHHPIRKSLTLHKWALEPTLDDIVLN